MIMINRREGRSWPDVMFKIILESFPPNPVVIIPAITNPAAAQAELIGIAVFAPSASAWMISPIFILFFGWNQLMIILNIISYNHVSEGFYPLIYNVIKSRTGIK